MKVPLDEVVFEKAVYPRRTDERNLPFWAIAHKYYCAMKAGDVFPPIALAKIKGQLILVDGWNRCIATRKMGLAEIEAEVLTDCKTYDDVYIESLRRNVTHGTSLSPYEIAVAVKQLREKGISFDIIAGIVHIDTNNVIQLDKERNSTGITVKRVVLPVRNKVTEENQRTLGSSSQSNLIKQVITLIRNDLLDLDNAVVRDAIQELREVLMRLTMEA